MPLIISTRPIEVRVTSLNGAFAKDEGLPGVYCWGYYDTEIFIPIYVGKSRNVFERLLQHYCRFKSGEYQIFSDEDLRSIYVTKTSSAHAVRALYRPTNFRSVIEELPKLQVMHNHMVSNFAFRYVCIPGEADRVIAERTLANYIGRERLITYIPKGGETELCTALQLLISPHILQK